MKPTDTPLSTNTPAKAGKDAMADGELKAIEDLAEGATPRQIQHWIARLEQLYEQKKARVRTELQDRVSDMIALNGYTLEELFSARILPSTTDLAEAARKAGIAQRERAGKLAETALRS
jgi:hypothetical protein